MGLEHNSNKHICPIVISRTRESDHFTQTGKSTTFTWKLVIIQKWPITILVHNHKYYRKYVTQSFPRWQIKIHNCRLPINKGLINNSNYFILIINQSYIFHPLDIILDPCLHYTFSTILAKFNENINDTNYIQKITSLSLQRLQFHLLH